MKYKRNLKQKKNLTKGEHDRNQDEEEIKG